MIYTVTSTVPWAIIDANIPSGHKWSVHGVLDATRNKRVVQVSIKLRVCVFIWCSVVLLPWVEFSLVWRWGQHEWWRTSWWHLCRVKHVCSSGLFSFFINIEKIRVSPPIWGCQKELCVRWFSALNCHSAPPHCCLQTRDTTTKKNVPLFRDKRGTHPVWAPSRPWSSCSDPAEPSALLFACPVTNKTRFSFLTSVKVLQRRSSSVLTFSSLEANRDSIPSFNLWYSWSDQIHGTLKCYFCIHTRLVTAEFSGVWWNV